MFMIYLLQNINMFNLIGFFNFRNIFIFIKLDLIVTTNTDKLQSKKYIPKATNSSRDIDDVLNISLTNFVKNICIHAHRKRIESC